MEIRERYKRLKNQVDSLKGKPLMMKLPAAEQCLESSLFLIEGLIDELEQLKGGQRGN